MTSREANGDQSEPAAIGAEITAEARKIEPITSSLDEPVSIVNGLRGGPVSLGDLGEYIPPNWLWKGYIAEGHMTLLAGFPKAGKTTLLGHVLRDLVQGGPMAGQRIGGRVLIVSEESKMLWTLRRDELQLPREIDVWAEPVADRASFDTWFELARTIAGKVKEGPKYRLVVLDTLASLWPVSDENSSSETTRAMTALREITRAGAGLLLVHHTRRERAAGEGLPEGRRRSRAARTSTSS